MIPCLRNKRLTITVIGCILIILGCASPFNPRPIEDAAFLERAQTQEENGVRVTAAVLSAEDCLAKFGVNLYSRGIQPVWLEIQNNNNNPVVFLPVGLDPEYVTPLESSYLSRFAIREADHDEMDKHFFARGMGNHVVPGNKISGFVFTNLDEGTKTFNVDVLGDDNNLRTFTFFIPVDRKSVV